MKHFFDQYQMWALDIIGKKLQNINGLIYIFEVPDLESPQQLQLVFLSNNRDVGLRCGKDGATIELIDSPMQESDLGEYGKEVIMNMSTSHLFYKYIGKVLSRFYIIYSETEKATIGIKLVFDNELFLLIINLGDEIKVFDSLPLDYEKNEGIHYFEVSA